LFQKISTLPPQRKFLPSGGGGEKKLFLIIVNVLGHPKGVGGLTSNFLRGGGMDVLWNVPITYVGSSCSNTIDRLNQQYYLYNNVKNSSTFIGREP
jgi:hypothetical protein